MAPFIFNSNNSVSGSGATFNSPAEGNPIIVSSDAFVLNSGNGNALYLDGGNYTVTVNGDAASSGTIFPGSGSGIELSWGLGASKLTVGSAGTVSGQDAGVRSQHDLNIANSGIIHGDAIGIDAYGGGNYTIRNNSGGEITAAGIAPIAIGLWGMGTHTIVNKGSIDGIILGLNAFGIENITNSGTITGDVMPGGGNDTLTNTGTIAGALYMGEGADVVTNRKSIQGGIYFDNGNDRLTNSGTIDSDVVLGEGSNRLVNSKDIFGGVYAGSGNDIIKNSGTLGPVDLGGGANTLTNSGTVEGGITGGLHDDRIINSGLINGSVNLGDGINTFINSGQVSGAVISGLSASKLVNSGTIGSINLGDGADSFSNSGQVLGSIGMGDGDDIFNGGEFSDLVADEGGSDSYSLAGGDDTFYGRAIGGPALNGDDLVNAGSGFDTYDASNATIGVQINLGTSIQDDIFDSDPAEFIAAGKATDLGGGQIGSDTITGFENATGGSGDDALAGNAKANVLSGGAGSDTLYGRGGKDILTGGDGSDFLVGGVGADTLTGGDSGADGDVDLFVFASLRDSTLAVSGRDVILAFEDGFDKIAFNSISGTPAGFTNADWNFLGIDVAYNTAGDTIGGVRVETIGSGWLVTADADGDQETDLAVVVDDSGHAIAWAADDFLFQII